MHTGEMAFSRMIDKSRFSCRCEGWMLLPARSNLLAGEETASSGTPALAGGAREERPPRSDTSFLEKAIHGRETMWPSSCPNGKIKEWNNASPFLLLL
jgi:hypothetical protein